MERYFTVVKVVGQKYYYSVKAENVGEAIEKVKKGEAGKATNTKEIPSQYHAG